MRQKKKNETVVKVNANIKLDVNGTVINIDDLIQMLGNPKPKHPQTDRKIPPAVIRKYKACVEHRDNLVNMLSEVRKMYNKNKKGLVSAAEQRVYSDIHPYLSKFISQNEKLLGEAIAIANCNLERAKKEYEESMYFVKAA